MFLPVVDCTWQYINAILILASEPDGKRPLFIDDFRSFHLRESWKSWRGLGSKLGLE